MSDKSRDVEPDHEEIVPGDPDATPEEDVTPAELVDEPDELAAAEAAVADPEINPERQPYGDMGTGDHAGPEARDVTRSDDQWDDDELPEELAEDEVYVDDDQDVIVDHEAEDARIAALEGEFTPEEQAAAAGASAIARKTAKAPVRKDAPTRRRGAALAEHEDPYKASNPAEFVAQSAGELKKVVWPTWPQLVTMFFAVLIFVLIIITIVALLDLLFGWTLLQLFGN